MKKNIILSVWAFILVIFDAVLCRYIGIDGIYPNIVFSFVICAAVCDDNIVRVTVLSLVCGLIADCLGGNTIGIKLFSFGICAVLCNYVTEKFFVPNILVAFISVILTSLLSRFVIFALGFTIFGNASIEQIFVPLVLKYVAYNAVISIILYPILKKTVYAKKRYDRR